MKRGGPLKRKTPLNRGTKGLKRLGFRFDLPRSVFPGLSKAKLEKPIRYFHRIKQIGDRKRQELLDRVPCMEEVRLRSDGLCEIRSVKCTGLATEGHERLKRSQGGSATDPLNVLHSCHNCNQYVETAKGRRWAMGRLVHGKPVVIERRSTGKAVGT